MIEGNWYFERTGSELEKRLVKEYFNFEKANATDVWYPNYLGMVNNVIELWTLKDSFVQNNCTKITLQQFQAKVLNQPIEPISGLMTIENIYSKDEVEIALINAMACLIHKIVPFEICTYPPYHTARQYNMDVLGTVMAAVVEIESTYDIGFKICRKRVEVFVDSTKEVLIIVKEKAKINSIFTALYLLALHLKED